jgi:hypothetical protein
VKKVRLVHGEPERAEGLWAAGFTDVAVPEAGDTMPMG